MSEQQQDNREGQKVRVNAWTQWGKVKRIMVGSCDNANFDIWQKSHHPSIKDDYMSQVLEYPLGPKHPKVIQAANEQLEGLVNILTDEQIIVHRPEPLDFSQSLKTPFFEVPNQYCATCPRDSLITFGNIIMEAPMSRRDRYFEVFSYRKTIEYLYANDENCFWKAAPKTSMADDMYNESWYDIDNEKRKAMLDTTSFALKNNGKLPVVFDAADFTRAGKDIFGCVSMTTNEAGQNWVQRELKPFGFRVHPMRFINDTTPMHIDATFVLLRPYLAMRNPFRPPFPEYEKLFIENGWKIITAPEPKYKQVPTFSQNSPWVAMNVLVISPNKVIVEQEETGLGKLLEDNGFDVIHTPFRRVYEFGGSLHCSTWDIEREDKMEDFFPSLSESSLEAQK